MNYNNLCYRCFCEKPIREKPCPKCGYKHTPNNGSPNCLPQGTVLHNRYIVGMALGIGGFGITYKCLDTKVGGICAVKEYFPATYAMRNGATRTVSVAENNIDRYNKIMKRFVEEADLVKQFHHRNVITIFDSFFENNTAYYVMEYCDGIDLRRYTNNFSRKLEYNEGMNILYQVMNGLEYIHAKGILHRDIAPDNIYITKNNSVKILDFGSARSEMDQYNRELSVIVKVGYAPIEQYGGRGKQGSYTDIYALGATFYHLFTSKIPIESTQRVAEDNLQPFSSLRPDLPDNLKYCIEKSMELTTAKRIANIQEMKRILGLTNASVTPQPKRQGHVKPPVSVKPPVNANNRVASGKPPVRVQSGAGASGSRVSSSSGNRYIPGGHNRAGLGRRMGAYFLDTMLWGLIYFVVTFVFLGVSELSVGVAAFFPIVFALINTILELLMSATVGKALLQMYVCSASGGEVEPGQIFARNLVKMLGVLVLLFAQDGNLLEDTATDTIVCIKE